MEVRACAIAASRLGYDLKGTIEKVKAKDFPGTARGLVTLAQQTGMLEACGLKLEDAHLLNAVMALPAEHWDVIEEQLRAFGEHAYQRVMGPASVPTR